MAAITQELERRQSRVEGALSNYGMSRKSLEEIRIRLEHVMDNYADTRPALGPALERLEEIEDLVLRGQELFAEHLKRVNGA